MDITWVIVNDHRDKAKKKQKNKQSKIKPTNYLDVV